jgi:predicted RNase H-like HicB family nuclease
MSGKELVKKLEQDGWNLVRVNGSHHIMTSVIPCRITYCVEDKCWYVESPGFYDGIMTDGDDLEDAKAMAREAVNGLYETYIDHGLPFEIPKKGGADWYDIPIVHSDAFLLKHAGAFESAREPEPVFETASVPAMAFA